MNGKGWMVTLDHPIFYFLETTKNRIRALEQLILNRNP